MRLRHLFKIQNIIDNEIRDFCQRNGKKLDRERLLKTQILALAVKTAELANLTKCYKYQRIKVQPERKKLIIRYIDCFKFLFSIGNDHNFNIIDIDLDELLGESGVDNLIDLFLGLFEKFNTLKKELSGDNYILSIEVYIEIFKDFLVLGNTLGLTFEEVFDYYDNIFTA